MPGRRISNPELTLRTTCDFLDCGIIPSICAPCPARGGGTASSSSDNENRGFGTSWPWFSGEVMGFTPSSLGLLEGVLKGSSLLPS